MRKLYSVQYLRAIAATAIVVTHADHGLLAPGLAHRTPAGVDLFFVISGFLMWSITDQNSRIASFLKDRIIRIVPVYWICTAVAAILVAMGAYRSWVLQPGHLLCSLLFIPCLSPNAPGHIYPLVIQGWTLNFEMVFYVAFALSLLLARRQQILALSGFFAALVVAGLLLKPADPILRSYTDPIMLEFVAGLWIGAAHKSFGSGGGIAAAGWPLLAAAALWFAVAPVEWPRAIAFGIPAALLLLSVLAFERHGAGVRLWPWAVFLGDASYSIYLWHSFALPPIEKLLHRVIAADAVVMVIATVGGVAAGCAAHLLVEKPILAYFRRRKFRHGAPVPGGV